MHSRIIVRQIPARAERSTDNCPKTILLKGNFHDFAVNLFGIFNRNLHRIVSHGFYFWKQFNRFRREGGSPQPGTNTK
jgi:hypothetical protein